MSFSDVRREKPSFSINKHGNSISFVELYDGFMSKYGENRGFNGWYGFSGSFCSRWLYESARGKPIGMEITSVSDGFMSKPWGIPMVSRLEIGVHSLSIFKIERAGLNKSGHARTSQPR